MKPERKKILITSALLYANGPLHFGHLAGSYLPADCCARFYRMQKQDVLYICGSDEYGVAISLSAELAQRTPKEQVDLYHGVNMALFQKLGISFDHYSRTTWPRHREAVYEFFHDLVANHYVEEMETEQLFSEQDKRFLADRYVVGTCPCCGYAEARGDECTDCGGSFEATDLGNPRSKLTGAPLTRKKTRHWFLRLDLLKDRVQTWLETRNWKPNVTNFVKRYTQELRPRAITRDMSWGVPVPLPGTEGKVLYVWFDAPIGYISATKEWAEQQGTPECWKDYWCDEKTHLIQFVGKDNIPFHAVIFPAMTMGQNRPYKLVDDLAANEFYHLEGRQFSKSDGWYIDLADFLEHYSADQLRYAIASNAPETADSEFTWKDFQLKCNSDLVGKFGNFIHRTLVFIQNNCAGRIPQAGAYEARDREFLTAIASHVEGIDAAYRAYRLRRVCQLIMELAQLGNVYFDYKRPWVCAKEASMRETMCTTLVACLACVKALTVVSYPIIPASAEKIWHLLGQSTHLPTLGWKEALACSLVPDTALPAPKPLFTKIEDEQMEKEIQTLRSQAEEKAPSAPVQEKEALLTIDEFKKVKMRVAQITHAEPVPKSKRLLRLQVDTGEGTRTIVSGIAHKFSPETLIGKHVVVVLNLEPATLMGVQSQGMLLVGTIGDSMQLLECSDLPPGALIS